MTYIIVNNRNYKVLDDLGFQGGYLSKEVYDPDTDTKRKVVKEGGRWRFWTAKDRLR